MRKFKPYIIKRKDVTGVGMEEYNETMTLSVASIYLPYRPSHKELFHIVARHVVDQLEGDQVALLRITRPLRAKYQWFISYSPYLFVKDEPSAHVPFIQAQQLAEDALQRQKTVVEGFVKGVQYKVEI